MAPTQAVRAVLLLAAAASLACTRPAGHATVPPAAEREVALGRYFAGIDSSDAAFMVLDARSGEVTRYNAARARRRFVPASTFKIANTLIALETGVVSGADFPIAWDSTAPRDPGFWATAWSRDHTLRTAMQHSVYWYYQEIARRVGAERMQAYLDRFDYGNRSMGGGLDRFWLHGDLRISPDEQVRFLERLHAGTFGVSPSSARTLRDIMLLEEAPAYRLFGKTGTADVTATRELAWLVGWVERDDSIWIFALNMEGEEVWERWGQPAARLALVRSLLAAVGVLPADDPGAPQPRARS